MKSRFAHLVGLCAVAITSIAGVAYATKGTGTLGVQTMIATPVQEYRPHDDIREMSVAGATLCTPYAMRMLLEQMRDNRKATFTSMRQYLLAHGGECRVVDTFPELWNIDRVIPMTDDGEEMQLYVESVFDFVQDAGFGNAILIKKEYALCRQTTIDRGCF